MKTKALARGAVLTAAALALSLLESALPLALLIPLPGVKLGLANVVTMVALFSLGGAGAATVVLCRVFLLFLMSGSTTALLMSLSGSVLALAGMLAARRFYPRRVSLFGISMAGAALHSVGQIACATVLMKSAMIVYYLPFLLVISLICGVLTACAAWVPVARFEKK